MQSSGLSSPTGCYPGPPTVSPHAATRMCVHTCRAAAGEAQKGTLATLPLLLWASKAEFISSANPPPTSCGLGAYLPLGCVSVCVWCTFSHRQHTHKQTHRHLHTHRHTHTTGLLNRHSSDTQAECLGLSVHRNTTTSQI